jgi:hypothetical protein
VDWEVRCRGFTTGWRLIPETLQGSIWPVYQWTEAGHLVPPWCSKEFMYRHQELLKAALKKEGASDVDGKLRLRYEDAKEVHSPAFPYLLSEAWPKSMQDWWPPSR